MTTVNIESVAEPRRASEAGRYDAFTSNAREHSAIVAHRLRKVLRNRGQHVWLDVDIVGVAKWRACVMRAIEACRALIFVIGPGSVAPEASSQELDDAVALKQMVVPVVYQDNL